MKPGPQRWATNSIFSGGPDAGSPTKAELPAGYDDDGYYRNRAVAPDFWNMYRWRIAERLDNLAAGRLKTINTKIATAPTWGVGANHAQMAFAVAPPAILGAAVAWQELFIGYANDALGGLNQCTELLSYDGEYWTNTAFGTNSLICYDAMGAVFSGVGGGAAFAIADNGVAANNGTWYWARGLGGPLTVWYNAAGAGSRAYCIDTSAPVSADTWCSYHTGGNIRRATALGGATAAATAAGLASTATAAIRHTKHAPGTLYPDDPGNDCWMCLTRLGVGYQVYTSTDDGQNWSALAPGTPPAISGPRGLGYSAWGNRWGAIDVAGTYPTFAYSEDNGANWSIFGDSFEFNAYAYSSLSLSGYHRLATDGFGHWMAAFSGALNAGTNEIFLFGSRNNGSTWFRVMLPTSTYGINPDGCFDLVYADGAFYFITTQLSAGPTANLEIFSTAKVNE